MSMLLLFALTAAPSHAEKPMRVETWNVGLAHALWTMLPSVYRRLSRRCRNQMPM